MGHARNDRAPGDLARRIAHALRSPLGVVGGALGEHEGAPPDMQARLMTLARRGTTRLYSIAERLALLGRLEGDVTLERTSCELVTIVSQATASIVAARARRGVVVVAETSSATPCPVQADRALLLAACVELVDNAVRFADGRVTTAVRTDDTSAVLRVCNDGPGLTEDALTAALDRSTPLTDRSGLGIGLWMANVVAVLHGGGIRWVRIERGSAVELSLRR